MKVREIVGDLLSSECSVICHQVNCMAVMGSGVSKAIRKRYPLVNEQYSTFLHRNYFIENGEKTNTSTFLGLCQIVKIGDRKYVANLFGQDRYGNDGRQYTNYSALQCSLFNLRRLVLFGGYGIDSIAFPHEIGCGKFGGADWGRVKDMILRTFEDLDIVIEFRKLN